MTYSQAAAIPATNMPQHLKPHPAAELCVNPTTNMSHLVPCLTKSVLTSHKWTTPAPGSGGQEILCFPSPQDISCIRPLSEDWERGHIEAQSLGHLFPLHQKVFFLPDGFFQVVYLSLIFSSLSITFLSVIFKVFIISMFSEFLLSVVYFLSLNLGNSQPLCIQMFLIFFYHFLLLLVFLSQVYNTF